MIDLYIFLRSQNCPLPRTENTSIFIELSNWRDCSLRDGVESYYATKGADELNQLEKSMIKYAQQDACNKCIVGIRIYQEKGDLSSLDNWIIDNEWAINDFLVELVKE